MYKSSVPLGFKFCIFIFSKKEENKLFVSSIPPLIMKQKYKNKTKTVLVIGYNTMKVCPQNQRNPLIK